MKFKVGDRVRIVGCDNPRLMSLVGKEATITGKSVVHDGCWHLDLPKPKELKTSTYSFAPEHLEPLINPDEEAWQAFKSLHLKPDPALILAKEAA